MDSVDCDGIDGNGFASAANTHGRYEGERPGRSSGRHVRPGNAIRARARHRL